MDKSPAHVDDSIRCWIDSANRSSNLGAVLPTVANHRLISAQEVLVADNLFLRGQPDRSKVNVHEQWELDYWTSKWGVSAHQLRSAVAAVGVSAAAVARYLGKPL